MAEKEYYDSTGKVATASDESVGVAPYEEESATRTTNGLQRRLKARHVQMIAIGSNLGTGLFIGSGKSLHSGGPVALVTGFILISISVTIMMQCLGEMAVVLPVTGSFARYATRFFDPALGFATGWQYWLAWVSVFGAESSAFVILIQYWDDDSRLVALWISIFVIVNLCIHLCPVRIFGEVEFVISAIKVIAVVGFLIVTWAIMGGAGSNGTTRGAEFWHLPGLENGLHNGFKGLASVFVNAAFATGGVEMVGIVAGETQHPRWTLPRAIRTLMWRFVIFYVFSTLFLSFVVPYNAPELLGNSNARSSPYVIAIQLAGIKVLPSILNAVVVLSVCSVGSSSIYICSRTLKALAEDGFAFKIFARTDRHGRPYPALIFSGCIGIVLAYINVSSTGQLVFSWFNSISGLAFFIAWMVIIACNWRFHAALHAQKDDALQRRFAFRQPGFPWLSIFAFVSFAFMVVCQFIVSVWPIGASPSAGTFFNNFLSVPIFLVSWGGYKLIFRTKWQKLSEIDLQSGRIDPSEAELEKLEHYETLTTWQKAVTYLRF